MRYQKLGQTDIQVSCVGIGTWAMGGDYWGEIDEQLCVDAIHASLDMGVNLIDTAPIYGLGRSEKIVGKAIKGRKREDIILATKCGVPYLDGRDLSKKSVIAEAEASLRRLGADYIDIYQAHWPDVKTPAEETMEAFLQLKKEGKIRAIGLSNFSIEQIDAFRQYGVIDTFQPQYSLVQRQIEKDILPYCRKAGFGVLTYGSLGAGLLTGKYTEAPKMEGAERRRRFYKFYEEPYFSRALTLVEVLREIAAAHSCPVGQVAINWVNQQPGVSTSLVGCKNPRQAQQNAGSGEWELSAEEIARITQYSDEVMKERF